MAEETTATPTPQTPPPSNGVTHNVQHVAETTVPSFRLEQELMAKRELTEANQSASQSWLRCVPSWRKPTASWPPPNAIIAKRCT